MTRSGTDAPRKRRRPSAFWLKQLHQWHWISSAICLVGLLLFAVTGITLNHAADIEGTPVVTQRAETLPPGLLQTIAARNGETDGDRPIPKPIADWLDETLRIKVPGSAEWSAAELYVALPQPGGDAWATIDRTTGAVAYEHTDRGWISYLNDLHKGRNTGTVWFWFIDVFAVGALVFAFTGLILLQLHAPRRPSTWPLVAVGLAIPAIIAIAFIH